MSLTNTLKTQYIEWLSNEFLYTNIASDVIRIDTPFLDNDFDNVVLYVEPLNNNNLLLTDDGYTLSNLDSMGFSINNKTKKRKNILQDICDSFGVTFNESEKEFTITTSIEKYAIAKHRLLQAILRINDMSFLNDSNIKSLFFEEVAHKLDKNEILYNDKQSIIGPNGISFYFDFTIPVKKNSEKKDKLVRIISTPNNLNNSKVLATDVRLINKVHKNKYDYFVVYNDVKNSFSNFSEVETILTEDDHAKITPIKFSEIDKKIELLQN